MTDSKEFKPPVAMSASGLVPTDIEQAFRMAQAFARAGDMVPRDFQGKPDMIFAAIETGLEIGLAPMQALASIAVINGRRCIWGDALPALAQKHGHHLDVEIVGEGDGMKAVATLERGDTGKKIVREFSVEDAKRAGLWGNVKRDPWIKYPKRMLMMRARSWAMRDGAADAMMGMSVAEEAQDMRPMKDVTPQPSGFAKLAQEAREAAEAASGADTPEESVEAVSEPLSDSTEVEDAEVASPDAYMMGFLAAKEGSLPDYIPAELDQEARVEWQRGFEAFVQMTIDADNLKERG